MSLIESAQHPDFSSLYRRLGFDVFSVTSQRKAFTLLKKQPIDIVVAEFFYGYGNNYAGANISNLDVLFSTMQKYAPKALVVILVAKNERQYVDKLDRLNQAYVILTYPVNEKLMSETLTEHARG